jgi:hypothetical protein
MSKETNEEVSILKDDVDSSHSSDDVSAKVELEQLKEQSITPKDGTSTSQFKVLLGSSLLPILSLLITLAVGFKWIGEELEAPLRNSLIQLGTILTTILGGGVVANSGVFIYGRNQVSLLKTKASAAVAEIQARAASYAPVSGTVTELKPGLTSAEFSHGMVSGSPLGASFGNPVSMAKFGISMTLMMLGNPKSGKKATAVKALKAALAALNSLDEE